MILLILYLVSHSQPLPLLARGGSGPRDTYPTLGIDIILIVGADLSTSTMNNNSGQIIGIDLSTMRGQVKIILDIIILESNFCAVNNRGQMEIIRVAVKDLLHWVWVNLLVPFLDIRVAVKDLDVDH